MINLLCLIQTELRNNIDYINDSDIFLTVNEDIIPAEIRYPAIAIKDGASRFEQQLSNNYMRYDQVRITVYKSFLSHDLALIGNEGDAGLFSIISDIFGCLVGNRLNCLEDDGIIGQIMNAFPISEDSSLVSQNDETKEIIVRKTIVFSYQRHKTWE